jgi:hypothetical protein
MIISASLTHLYVKKLIKLNVNAILLKPYDLNNIVEKINQVQQGIEIQRVPVAFQK